MAEEKSRWHTLKQYLEGTFNNGKRFSVEITPEFTTTLLREAAEKQLGKKIKEVSIVCK